MISMISRHQKNDNDIIGEFSVIPPKRTSTSCLCVQNLGKSQKGSDINCATQELWLFK